MTNGFDFATNNSICRKIAKELGLPFARVKHSIKVIMNPGRVIGSTMSYGTVIIPGLGKFVKRRAKAKNRAKIYGSSKYLRYVASKRENRKLKPKT